MRILFLATYFPDPRHPSRGNWALEQAQAFKAAGHQVQVIVPTAYLPKVSGFLSKKLRNYTDTVRAWTPGGLPVLFLRWPYYPWHFFGKWNSRFPASLIRIAWPFLLRGLNPFIKEFKPDYVCAHHTLVSGQLAYNINCKWNIPYIVTDHEVGDLLACGQNAHVAEVFNRVGGRARAMIVVSRTMEEVGRRYLPEIAFQTIYNGSSFPVFQRQVDQGKKDSLRIFSCAKFYGRKDIPLLIRAFDAIADQFNVVLRIAGDGPERNIVEAAARNAKNRDKIRLIGLIAPEEVREEMKHADIFALVGWAEPFGVVFLEAMASGLPIILCEDAGIAEVLSDGETALFTHQQDQSSVEQALSRILGDTALRRRLGHNGQELFIQEFNWKTVIQNYLTLMKS